MNGFTPEELDQFSRDGFVVVRALVDRASCEAMKAVAKRDLAGCVAPLEYEAQVKYPGSPASLDAPGGRTVRRLLQAYARDPLFRSFAVSPGIVSRMTQLLGSRVELSQAHHNCVMTKHPAFSSATGWHQDVRYWSFQRPELVSTWLALGREHAENGCLRLIPGSHRIDFQPAQYDAEKFFRADTAENLALLRAEVAAELDEGDVLFFHCRALHAAGRNLTGQTKYAVVFTCHAADNRPLPGTRSASLAEVPL